jgi:hypothetical protein
MIIKVKGESVCDRCNKVLTVFLPVEIAHDPVGLHRREKMPEVVLGRLVMAEQGKVELLCAWCAKHDARFDDEE